MAQRVQVLVLVLLSAGICAAFGFVPAASADGGDLNVQVVSIDDSGFPTVRAVLSVDEGGLPLQGITAQQVDATEGGSPATVLSLEPAFDSELPIALVLVIDASGSVAGDLIAEVQAAAAELITELGPADSVAVLSFADDVQVVQELTTDHQQAIDAVRSIEAIGNTALYDAVGAASALAAAADVPRTAVVLLTDGSEYGGLSAATRESSLDAIGSGAPFYAVGVGDFADVDYLTEVAQRSGGRYFSAQSVTEISDVYTAIEDLLRSQYIITLESASEPTADTSSLTVTVRADGLVGTGTTNYESQRPIDVQPVVPAPSAAQPAPTVTLPATGAERVASEEAASSRGLIWGASAATMIILAALWLLWRRRRMPDVVVPESIIDRRPLRWETRSADQERRTGYLVPLTVAGIDSEVSLDEGPITIGTASDCRARVDGVPDVAAEHARIWLRDSRPMLHHVAEGFETRVNGRSVRWAALSDGDEIEVGPYRFRFAGQLTDPPDVPKEASA